jgi:RHS repeat-associated protein
MARTAPAPNIPPIPGMCPSLAVLAGGGDGGGGSGGSAGDGSGDDNAGANQGGENAEADQRGAPDYEKYPECGYASHPVDVVTGRAFTHPITDLELPGPLPLAFRRMYSSKMAERDAGLGFGWGHTFGWEIEVRRRSIIVWNEQGIAVDFPMIPQGADVIGPWGWVLRREAWGFAVDADDGVWHLFSASEDEGKRWRLTAIEDRNKNRIALTYDDGRLVEVKDSAGRTIRITPTREGRMASIQVIDATAQGQAVTFATYTYDARGNLVSVTDADGFAAHYAYDDDHRLTSDTDRAGLCFHFVYDREGRCVESWGDYPGKRDPSLMADLPKFLHDGVTRAKGIHHCKFEYGADGYTEVVDSTQARRFFGNSRGLLTKSVDGGGVMTATYRDDGHLLARTDAMGGMTSFDRDARGRIVKRTDPLGRTTVITRDAAGLPIEIVDAAGGTTTMGRDARGNVLVFTDAAGGTTSFRYDERGLLLEEVSPTGARMAYVWDAQGNLLSHTAPNGAVFQRTYDGLGRCLAETDPFGAVTRWAYSARGDLLEERDAAGGVTRYAYDGEHHLVQHVDPRGHATQFTWGGYHKLADRRDAAGHAARLRYNLEGELTEVHNERGEVHRLTYNAAGRLVGETTFDGRQIEYRHDRMGRVTRIMNGAREATALTYDLAGQIVKRELADGSAEEYAYDTLGNLAAVISPEGEIRYDRDALGRVVREAQVVRDVEHWIEATYDAAGERVGRTTSLGHTEVVARDALGARTRTLLDGAHPIEHTVDLLGREIARSLPHGGWIQSAYDAVGRLSARRAGAGTAASRGRPGEPEWLGARPDSVTAETTYRYDEAGELIDAWDRSRGPTQYAYDPLGQLVSMVPEKARAQLFSFDEAGNLYPRGESAPVRAYARGNRLTRDGDWDYAWDDDGRLREKRRGAEVWRYTWDAAGLLRQVERPDGLRVDLRYDPFARRLSKRVTRPGASASERLLVSETRFVWDGDLLVHEIEARPGADGARVLADRTYWFEDEGFAPLAHREEGRWLHYVTDPVGTPERLVGDDGKIAGELRRHAWGETEASRPGEATTRIRFPGQAEDEETGLWYSRFRYYDPALGRFISADPLGLAGGLNAFAYAPNPLTWEDPLGLAGTNKRRRRQAARIEAATQRNGNVNRGCRGAVSSKEAARLGREFVGPDHTRVIGRNGNEILTSNDGLRRYRGPDNKAPAFDDRGQPYSQTGRQANFETFNRGGQRTSNVHLDVRD